MKTKIWHFPKGYLGSNEKYLESKKVENLYCKPCSQISFEYVCHNKNCWDSGSFKLGTFENFILSVLSKISIML